MMKSLWHSASLFVTVVIAFVVASSYEGSDLPDDQVEQVLALYNRHCRSAYGLSSTSAGHNVHVLCKEGREDYGPPKKQVIKIPPGPPPKKNILFVEAPTYKVKHDITLVGDAVKPPRTVIYVLPNKNNHNFNFLYRHGQQEVQKPQVYFLGNKAQGGIGSPPHGGYPGPIEIPSGKYGVNNIASVTTVNSKPVSNNPVGGYEQGYPSFVQQSQYQTSESPTISSYQTSLLSSTSSKPPVNEYVDQPPSPVTVTESQPVSNPSQQSGRNEELSLPGLGPEYELVPADPETLSQYERYFSHIQKGYSSAGDRIKNHQSRSISQGDLPLGFTVQNTAEFVQQNEDVKPALSHQSSIQQETNARQESSVTPRTEEKQGRIIFPDESIQQFQYSSLAEIVTTEEPKSTTTSSTEKPVTRKTISHLQRNLFKRKSHISKIKFPEDPIVPEKYLLSYHDYYNYMGSPGSQEVEPTSSSSSKETSSKKGRRKRIRNKSRSSKESSQQKYSNEEKAAVEIQDRIASISSANSALKSHSSRQTSSPFHAKLLLAFASKAEMESTSTAPSQFSHYRTVYSTESTTTPSPSFYSSDDLSAYTVVENLRIAGNSRNRKRSNSPSYEMIPASLVSYSYSKV